MVSFIQLVNSPWRIDKDGQARRNSYDNDFGFVEWCLKDCCIETSKEWVAAVCDPRNEVYYTRVEILSYVY